MSVSQERKFFRIIILLVLLSLLWILFAPGSGLLSFFTKRAELNSLEKETALLSDANNTLQNEIDRLQDDPLYLEKVARSKFDMLKENERIYDFSKETKKKKN